MTKQKLQLWIHVVSLLIALAGGLLGAADKITAIPGLPGWLSMAFPVVIAFSIVVNSSGGMIVAALSKWLVDETTGTVPPPNPPIAPVTPAQPIQPV